MQQMQGETDKMLTALEKYYEAKYNEPQRDALRRALGNPPKAYLLEVYTQVTMAHPAQYGKVPDLAVVSKVRAGMDRPETYLPPDDVPRIEYNPEVKGLIDDHLATRTAEDGEQNHYERQRIRTKVSKGDATRAEQFWIMAIDEYGGNWREAYKRTAAVAS